MNISRITRRFLTVELKDGKAVIQFTHSVVKCQSPKAETYMKNEAFS